MEKERIGFIYILICLVNGKAYVGQTIKTRPEIRWAQHVKSAFVHYNERPLYRAMRKYGLKNFAAEVLWTGCESRLNAMERRFIQLHCTFIDDGWGYNLTTGGDHFRMSRRTRRKLSRIMLMAYVNNPMLREEVRQRNLAYFASIGGQPVEVRKRISKTKVDNPPSARVRRAMGKSRRGVPLSDERHSKMSDVGKKAYENNPDAWKSTRLAAVNRPWTKKQYRVMKLRRGYKASAEARMNMSKAHTGVKLSPNHRASLSEANRRRYLDPAAHQKTSDGLLEYYKTHSPKPRKPSSLKTRRRQSKAVKANWAKRKAEGTACWLRGESRTKASVSQKKRFERPGERERVSDANRAYYANTPGAREANATRVRTYVADHPEAVAKCVAAMIKANTGRKRAAYAKAA